MTDALCACIQASDGATFSLQWAIGLEAVDGGDRVVLRLDAVLCKLCGQRYAFDVANGPVLGWSQDGLSGLFAIRRVSSTP